MCGSWQSSAVWAFPRLSSSHTPVKGWRVTKRLWTPAVHSTGHNCLAYCLNVFSVHSTLVITACLGFIRLLQQTWFINQALKSQLCVSRPWHHFKNITNLQIVYARKRPLDCIQILLMFDTHNESLYTVHVGRHDVKYLELQNDPFYNISHGRLCITRIHV